mgnify:CR=1 FL=1
MINHNLNQLAGKLGLLKIPVFMFQERGDPVARNAFIELSRLWEARIFSSIELAQNN